MVPSPVLTSFLYLVLFVDFDYTFVTSFSPSVGKSPFQAHLPPTTAVHLFDKVFEESGPLGKGITVGKVQVALTSGDRGGDSIFGLLERKARNTGDSPQALARMAYDVCMALLRKNSDWTAACSESKWFKADDYGKAESQFNDWANKEAFKFEKEYIPDADSSEQGGGATTVVVSLVIEIEGDETNFDGAGYSLSGTKEVLTSIASNIMVDEGEVASAVEVFWTPGDRDEVMTNMDLIVDFPELISL